MLFNSSEFVLFLAVLLPVYAVLRGTRPRQVLLLVASYAFYAHWDWRYVFLLALSTTVDFTVGHRMHAARAPRARRLWLLLSLVTNLGLLGVFKYGNLVLGTAGRLLDVEVPTLPGEVPVGISFYTFQTLSYTIDVYRRQTRPCESPLRFAMYVAFFPQLVAGPIVRSVEFLPQARRLGDLGLERTAAASQRFLVGLFKKVVIADNVALFVDALYSAPHEYDALTLWCGAYGFALQVYCDFSAYTDMALALGQVFGLRLPENFDAPYLARSVTGFWRRWHMTLSTWLRDYLYIPLGGSRGGEVATYRNLMITMMLSGLWHGAAWSFVLWGAIHGLVLSIERMFGVRPEPDRPLHWRDLPRLLLTLHIVTFALVIFRSPDYTIMDTYMRRMLTAWEHPAVVSDVAWGWAVALAALLVGQWALRSRPLLWAAWRRAPSPVQGLGLAALALGIAYWHVDDVAFVYFQF